MVNVKVYSTPTCPWCHRVKDFLKEHDISFDDVDVSIDQDAAREMVEKTNQVGVPVVEVDGQMIVGFDQVKLEEIFGL